MFNFPKSISDFKFDSSKFFLFTIISAFLIFLGNPSLAILSYSISPAFPIILGGFSFLGILVLIYCGFDLFKQKKSELINTDFFDVLFYGSCAGLISGFLNGVSISLYFGNSNSLSFLPILILPIHGIFFGGFFSLLGYLINLIISKKRIKN